MNQAWVLIGLAAAASLGTPGEDWPQWMGPRRDNIWRASGPLLEQFPPEGPPLVWRTPVAGGYAGPAVARGRVYLGEFISDADTRIDNSGRKKLTGTERFRAFDAATGQPLWAHQRAVEYTISYPAGPRCTPIVHQDKVYSLGAEGHLDCFAAETGQLLWSKNLQAEYHTQSPLWGYAAHLLLDGNKLITLAGGPGSHVVALDKDTGKEIWRAQSAVEQGYALPTIITAGGQRQLILLKPDAVAAIDPDTGRELWSTPYQATNGSIIMSPVVCGDYLFAGGFNDKNLLLKLDRHAANAEVVWRDLRRHGLSAVNVQPFVEGTTIYGFDQNGELMAVEIPSGKRLWTTTAPIDGKRPVPCGTAFLIKQGDRFWLFNELGELIIARLSPQGYSELARTKLLKPTQQAFGRSVVWCMPAFAGTRMYVRNDEELICVELGRGK